MNDNKSNINDYIDILLRCVQNPKLLVDDKSNIKKVLKAFDCTFEEFAAKVDNLNRDLDNITTEENDINSPQLTDDEVIASHTFLIGTEKSEQSKLVIKVTKPYRCNHMWCSQIIIEGKPSIGEVKGINSLHVLCRAVGVLQNYIKILNKNQPLYECPVLEELSTLDQFNFEHYFPNNSYNNK